MGKANFSDEFKRDAVAQITERGYLVAEVSQRFGVSQHSLYAWKRQLARQVSGDAGQDAEIRQLKRELARVAYLDHGFQVRSAASPSEHATLLRSDRLGSSLPPKSSLESKPVPRINGILIAAQSRWQYYAPMRYLFITMIFGLTTACSSASNQPLPPIADKLPVDVRVAQKVFDQRVKAAYPVGSAEKTAIAELQKNGFEISPLGPDGYRSADIHRGSAICTTIWSVRWKAEVNSITEALGMFGHRCP